jgi:hypothetical protein
MQLHTPRKLIPITFTNSMSNNFGVIDCGKNGTNESNALNGSYRKAGPEDCVDAYDDKRQYLPNPSPPRHSC